MASLGDLIRARQATASTDEPPELLKRPPEEPAPKKTTLGDLVRARQAAAAPPGATAGASLGDVFRRDKEREETPELLRRPEPGAPEPSDESESEPPELLKRPPEEAPPGAYGVPTTFERVAIPAARFGAPLIAGIGAGALSGPGGPVVGPLVGASAGTATDLALQRYETSRGLRKEVSPYGVMWSGALNAFPGIPLGPELSVPARIAARTAEGTGIGTIGTTGGTLLEEGRLPTKEELAWGAGMGAAFGAGGGTLEAKGVPWLHERSAEFVGPRPEGEMSWRQTRAAKKFATSAEQLAGETTSPPVGEQPRMVTRPGETIGGAPAPEEFVGPPAPPEFVGPPAPEMQPHPVGSDVHFREIGEQERMTPGRIVAHEVDPESGAPRIMVEDGDGFVRGRPMDDVELAPGAEAPPGADFVGPPEPTLTERFSPGTDVVFRDYAGGGAGRVVGHETDPQTGVTFAQVETPQGMQQVAFDNLTEAAPSPEGPPGTPPPGGEEPPPGEQGPWGRPPTFRRYPGVGEALTGDEIAAQRHADPERVTRAIDSIDREFGDALPDESRARLKQQIVDNQERFEYLGRGKQTMERTRGLGRDYVVDLDAAKLEPKGTTWNAEQTQAMKNHIAGLDLAIQDAQQAFDDAPTPEHGLILQKAVQDQIDAFNIFRARGAEAGRTINIYKGTTEEIASGNQRLMMAALRRGVPPDKLADIIRSTKPKDVQARAEMLLEFADRGPWQTRLKDRLHTIFISNILSGPFPHLRNLLGNSVNALLNPTVAKPFAALDERFIRRLTPEQRTVYLGEVGKHFVAMRDALPDAVEKATEIFKRGYTGEQAASYDLPYRELGIGRHPALRMALNIVPRALGGADMFFRVLGQEASLNSQSYVKARSQALIESAAGHLPQGTSFAERLNQLYEHHRANLTPDMIQQATDEASRGVYQERDTVARRMTEMREWIPYGGGTFLMPFVTTQTNVTKQGLHYLPGVGYAMPSTRGKGVTLRTMSMHRGEALAGTVGTLLAPLALYAIGGKLHGSGPDDPKANDEWRRTHVPNSIEFGGHMVSVQQLGPLALPLVAIGNAWDKYDEIQQRDGHVSPEKMQEIFFDTVGRTAQSVLDQPYLQGISNLIDVMRHPTEARYRTKLVKDIATGFIPASGMVRYIEQIEDPTIRQGQTLGEKMQAGIPGMSTNVPPKLDVFGEPVQIEKVGGGWGRALIPVDWERTKRDPLREELSRQGLQLSPPSSITVKPEEGPPLTPREDLAVKQAKGKQLRVQLEELYASDAYRSADPETQKKMLKSMTGRTRAAIGARAKGLREQGITEEALRW